MSVYPVTSRFGIKLSDSSVCICCGSSIVGVAVMVLKGESRVHTKKISPFLISFAFAICFIHKSSI